MLRFVSILSLLVLFSCNLTIENIFSSPPGPLPPVISREDIAGTYQTMLTYRINSQTTIDSLSAFENYETTIVSQGDTLFTIYFDSTFIYQVPAIDFMVSETREREIEILSDQDYVTDDPGSCSGEFDGDQLSVVFYYLSLRSVKDSTYYLDLSGRREL